MEMTFEEWYSQVCEHFKRKTQGVLDLRDLPDLFFIRDCFDIDEMAPDEAMEYIFERYTEEGEIPQGLFDD